LSPFSSTIDKELVAVAQPLAVIVVDPPPAGAVLLAMPQPITVPPPPPLLPAMSFAGAVIVGVVALESSTTPKTTLFGSARIDALTVVPLARTTCFA